MFFHAPLKTVDPSLPPTPHLATSTLNSEAFEVDTFGLAAFCPWKSAGGPNRFNESSSNPIHFRGVKCWTVSFTGRVFLAGFWMFFLFFDVFFVFWLLGKESLDLPSRKNIDVYSFQKTMTWSSFVGPEEPCTTTEKNHQFCHASLALVPKKTIALQHNAT